MPRRLGQHFLDKQSILEHIAEAAAPERLPLMVEIGPGKGALTAHLLNRVDKLVVIELDSYLVGYLRQRFREQIEAGRLEIVESDVLKADLTAWGPAAITGNLPYYITSPILERVFTSPGWTRGTFLVQLEVAERVTASPGSRDYGYLSVQTQIYSEAKLLFEVSKADFRPPPKVESAVISVVPRPVDPDADAFLSFAGTCFRQKRKTLRNNLLVRYPREQVDQVTQGGMRAEQLGIAELRTIFERLRNAPVNPAANDEPALS